MSCAVIEPLFRDQHREERRDDADDEGAKERRPEAAYVEAEFERARQGTRQPQHEAVDDEREDAKRDDDDRECQHLRHRADEGVDDAEEERDAQKRQPAASVGDAGNDPRRHPERGGVDDPADEERHYATLALSPSAVLSTSIEHSLITAASAPTAASTGAKTVPTTPTVSGNSATVRSPCLMMTR